MVPAIVTFIGAILSMVAIGLLPGRTAIKTGKTERYDSWGKGAIYFLALVLIVVGGYALFDWYKSRDPFTMGNVALFAVLGFGLIADNLYLTRKLRKNLKQGPEQVHEVEEMKAPATGSPPVKVPKKKAKKPVATGGPATKAEVPAKPVATAKPAGPASEELIDVQPEVKKCPSCETPLEHAHDGACPVCGEKLPK